MTDQIKGEKNQIVNTKNKNVISLQSLQTLKKIVNLYATNFGI